MALEYTRPQQLKTMPVLKNIKGYIAISIKVKKSLVYKLVFPTSPRSYYHNLIDIFKVVLQIVTKDLIYKVFMT